MGCSGAEAGARDGSIETGDGPCEAAADCEGQVCVGLIDGDHPPVYCSESCSAGGCADGFYCDEATFALAGQSFCRFGDKDPAAPPEAPEEPPALPCIDDTECDEGLVCSSLNGERGCAVRCAVRCAVENDCTPPAVHGIVMDIATCGSDDSGRAVCVGDPNCFPNASNCISGAF